MRLASFFIFILFSCAATAQPDCSKIKTGTFRQPDEGGIGEMLIKRNSKTQTEENLKTGVIIKLDIVWTSDCSYQLKNMRVIKGKLPFVVPENAIVYTDVLEVDNKTVRVKTWINLAPEQAREYTFQIL